MLGSMPTVALLITGANGCTKWLHNINGQWLHDITCYLCPLRGFGAIIVSERFHML